MCKDEIPRKQPISQKTDTPYYSVRAITGSFQNYVFGGGGCATLLFLLDLAVFFFSATEVRGGDVRPTGSSTSSLRRETNEVRNEFHDIVFIF